MLVPITVLIVAGLAGLLGATFLPGWLASLQARSPAPLPPPPRGPAAPPSLQILVPAHNEEATIAATLASLEQAVGAANLVGADVIVGLDHCTDRTATIVRDFALRSSLAVSWQEKRGAPGKWSMLVEMTRSASAEWLAFVDCGSIWDRALVTDAIPHMHQTGVQAVAPSYLPQKASRLEKWNWQLEHAIKALEARSGGPISVHGATVIYRRSAVLAVLDRLTEREWLNDDLVLPSMIRLLDPANRVVYLRFAESARAYVLDQGVKPGVSVEYRRRRRIMHGNVEWLELLLQQGAFRRPVVALLALRRVCRMLWGYWLSCLLLAGVIIIVQHMDFNAWHWLLSALVGGVAVASSNFIRRLLMAYLTALRTPFQIAQHLAAGSAHTVDWQ